MYGYKFNTLLPFSFNITLLPLLLCSCTIQKAIICKNIDCISESINTEKTEKNINFSGISSLYALGDGTYKLVWKKPAEARNLQFYVYSREITPTTDLNSSMDYTSPNAILNDEFSMITENLTFKHNTCYSVRIKNENFSDTGTKEICTEHDRYEFLGANALISNDDGTWTLTWSAVPVTKNLVFKIYSRTDGENYTFDKPLIINSYKDLSITTANLSGKSPECYLVRAVENNKLFIDNNSNEFCTGHKPFRSVSSYNNSTDLTSIPNTYITKSFDGCISATATSNTQIKVEFAWPFDSSKKAISSMVIYRNGIKVEEIKDYSITSFLDKSLREGYGYNYTCKALIGTTQIAGIKNVSAETLNVNPPLFKGILKVEQAGNSSVRIKFGDVLSGSVPINRLEVYSGPDVSTNESTPSLPNLTKTYTTDEINNHSIVLDNIKNNSAYIFAVKACSINNLCAWGTINNQAIQALNADTISLISIKFTLQNSADKDQLLAANSATHTIKSETASNVSINSGLFGGIKLGAKAIPSSESFAGIKEVTSTSNKISGGVKVIWNAPINWSNYLGFNIYDVTCKRDTEPCLTINEKNISSLEIISSPQECQCKEFGCIEKLTSCEIYLKGKNKAYKKLNLLVRAYDSAGLQSPIPENFKTVEARTGDFEKPEFNSSINISWATNSNQTCPISGNGVCLSWNKAIDNQALEDDNKIYYRIYRGTESIKFNSNNSYPINAELLGITTNLFYKNINTDSNQKEKLLPHTTYYYAICALDKATYDNNGSNPTCNLNKASLTTPDLTAPVILSFTTSNSVPNLNTSWSLNWKFQDSVAGHVKIEIRAIETSITNSSWPNGTETPLFSPPPILLKANIPAFSTYPNANSKKTTPTRIAYLITAIDGDGNKSAVTDASKLDIIYGHNPATITNLKDNEIITSLEKEVVGTCDSSPGYSTTAEPIKENANQIRILSVKCLENKLTIRLQFTAGSGYRSFIVTTFGGGVYDKLTKTVYLHMPCPEGFVGVPGKNPAFESEINGLGNPKAEPINFQTDSRINPTKDFCVMKYAAKAGLVNNSLGNIAMDPILNGEKIKNIAEFAPESRPDGTPWTQLNRDEASARCHSLNETYFLCLEPGCAQFFDASRKGYSLISNTQWQTLARNIENLAENWAGNLVGGFAINRGYSSAKASKNAINYTQAFSDGGPLANPTQNENPYFGEAGIYNTTKWNSTGKNWETYAQKRTHSLSNGELIWDFSGNVWQWIKDERSELQVSTSVANLIDASTNTIKYADFTDAGNVQPGDKLLFGPINPTFNKTHGMGVIFGGNANGILRGGSYKDGINAGIFATAFNTANATAANNIGFRCTYLPTIPSTSDLELPKIGNIRRINSLGSTNNLAGNELQNEPINISKGGNFNLKWDFIDKNNSNSVLWVQVRKKISESREEFPSIKDKPYKEGFNLTAIYSENSWILSENNTYLPNDKKYINYLITVIDPAGNRSLEANGKISIYSEQSCPPGFIGVNGRNIDDTDNIGLGHKNAGTNNNFKTFDPTISFCVMKYPAKLMSANKPAANKSVGGQMEPLNNGNAKITYTTSSYENYLPESRATGTPWVNISRDEAIKACNALNTNYGITGRFGLLNNIEWQVIARNIENTEANWSNNNINFGSSGFINVGHTDNISDVLAEEFAWKFNSNALSNSKFDNNYYFGTGNSAEYAWNKLGLKPKTGTEQKRTFYLNNGQILWDFSGNIMHWVSTNIDNNIGISDILKASPVGVIEFTNRKILHLNDKLLFGPKNPFFNSKLNIGSLVGGSGPAIMRGAAFDSSINGGIYSAILNKNEEYMGENIGFRCVYLP